MRRPSVTLVLAAALLVLGFDYATFAATGDSLLLGRANSAGKTTTLQNTGSGPALSLKNKASAPPLVVSSSKRVVRLNADQLDGLDSTALQTSSIVFSAASVFVSNTTEVDFPLVGVPVGTYLFASNGIVQHSSSGLQCALFSGTTRLGSVVGADNVTGKYDIGMTTVVKLGTPDNLRVECDGGTAANFQTIGSTPVQFSFTRIDSTLLKSTTGVIPQN